MIHDGRATCRGRASFIFSIWHTIPDHAIGHFESVVAVL